MKWLAGLIGMVIVLSALAAAVLGVGTVAYDTPRYRVVETLGAIEIREYEPYLVAETIVEGNVESAGNQGFRVLAKYIFGDNRGRRTLAVTASANQEEAEGMKIAMTAPVTQEKAGDRFKIQFMMPSEYSLEELPEPNDSRVSIREVPAHRAAAVRYSGTWSKRNYQKNLELLRSALREAGYEPVGEPIWARYDAPFTLWFLRRNEILTEFQAPVTPR